MIRKLFLSLLLVLQLGLLAPGVHAALKMPDKGNFDELINNNKFVEAVDGKREVEDYVGGIFSEENIQIANGIIAGVAFIYLVSLGVKMLFSHGSEDRVTAYRAEFVYIAVGLLFISMGYFLGIEVFDASFSSLDADGDLTLDNFTGLATSLTDYLRMIVAAIAVGVILISGYRLMTAPEEDSISNEKSFARAFLLGVGFVLLSEVGVRILTADYFGGNPDASLAKEGIDEIVGIVNYLLTFVAGLCFFMMVMASLYYVVSFGDEDRTTKAKKIIISNLVASVIAFSSLVIIRVFING